MEITANSIIRKLRRKFGDHSAALEAKNWLDTHGSDQAALKVLNEIERQSADVEQIVWCTRWLQRNPHNVCSGLSYGTNSQSQILYEQEKFAKQFDSESGGSLRKLLHGAVNDHIVSTVHKWLAAFPNEKYSALLWAALLEVNANPETIELAKQWLHENKNDSAYDRVLARLIQSDASEAVLQLAEELIDSKQRSGSLDAVIAVLSTPVEKSLRNKAIEWCKLFLHGERSSFVASRLEEIVYDHEVADLLLDWCERNSEHKFVASKWARLLSKVPTETVMQKAWEWLEPDSGQHDWDMVFGAFLDAAAETKISIPRVAIEEAWDIWEQGDMSRCSHIGALLHLDHSEDVLEKLFLWIQANPNEKEIVAIILNELVAYRSGSDVHEFATRWLRCQKTFDFRIIFVLWRMLEVAPNPSLVELARKLLPTCTDDVVEWFTLQKLIELMEDDIAIRRAIQLVNIEARMAFRQHLDLVCGQLLLTLYQRKIEGVEFARTEWLRWHSTKHPKFAKLFSNN